MRQPLSYWLFVAACLLWGIGCFIVAARAEQPRLIDRPATRPAATLKAVQSIHREIWSDGIVVDRVAGTTFMGTGDTCAKQAN